MEKCCTFGQVTGKNITRSLRFACRVTKTTYTHSEHVMLIAFPQQKWLLESASVFTGTLPLLLFISYPVTSYRSIRSLYYYTFIASPSLFRNYFLLPVRHFSFFYPLLFPSLGSYSLILPTTLLLCFSHFP